MDDFGLLAPSTVAPPAGVQVELEGVRWATCRAPRETRAGMFDVTDAGEFQAWA